MASVNTSPLIAGRQRGGFITRAGGGGGLTPGETFLTGCEGWWDFRTNNLANKGTVGAAGNAALGVTPPTYNTDHYTFDGIDDYMRVPHNTSLDFTAISVPFSFGLILAQPGTIQSFGRMINKGDSPAGPFWHLMNNGTATSSYYELRGSSIPVALGAAYGTGKVLIGGVTTVFPQVNTFKGATFGTAVSDTRGISVTNTRDLFFGVGEISGAISSYQSMDLYGVFIKQGLVTAQNLTDICTLYGVTP